MRGRRGVTFVETLIILVVVMALLVLVLPTLKPSRAMARSGTGTLADLRRIEAAKDQYAADHHKKTGDPVTMQELVKGGYLRSTPTGLPPGTHFVVGSVGTPATITPEHSHDDLPAPAHSGDEEDQHH
jgi:competence protein ComGC